MRCLMRTLIVLILGGSVLAPEGRAQIPYNLNYDYYPRAIYAPLDYELYGWSGWGLPPQIRGDLARALGIYAQAAATQARSQRAQADRQRNEMVRQWNTFFWAAQHALILYKEGGRLPTSGREAAALEAELTRLRDHPELEEIASGAALNALLDQFTDPRLPSRALQSTRTPLDPALIRQIPYEYASEVVAILLERVTADTNWPRQLAIPALSEPRRALRAAVLAAVDEDLAGPLSEPTIRAVHRALQDLAQRTNRVVPPRSPQYAAAEAYLKELVGLARLLGQPNFDAVLAALDEETETTVEDLLSFMQMFNLRFGAATTPEQKEVYQTLYPILAGWRSHLKDRLGGSLPQGGVTLAGLRQQAAPALRIFATMSWDQLIGRPPEQAPEPRR